MRSLAVLAALGLVGLLLLPAGTAATGTGHYLPQAGDRFAYAETDLLTNGQGNYTGYTEEGYYNGSIAVTAVHANGTDNATYASSGNYHNSLGQSYPWSESGAFSFSAVTFHYVNGTDNQTGYTDPLVWFYMNDSLPVGATFYLLNTEMSVVSVNFAYPMASSSTGYVRAIFAEGNGSYQRDDVYGEFTASYNWRAYFDPGTGYVLGYVYTENDSNPAGDGFTMTDTVVDSQTSFALTPVAPPPSPPAPASSTSFPWALVVGLVVVVVVVVVIVAVWASRRKARPRIPRHPTSPSPGTMPSYAPPAPLNLTPGDQPRIQQVVLRETVKVPCQYCGTLMDSTATVCPKCGAPRT